jgi:hypothetical protein
MRQPALPRDLKAGGMRFLIRVAFWLAIVLALLPSLGSQPAPKVNVGALEAMTAARATVTDLQAFCARQPDTCAVGSQAAVAFGHRAQAGAKLLYDYLSDQLGSDEGDAAVITAEPVPMPARRPAQLIPSPGGPPPGGQSPQSRREARSNRPTS